MDRERPVPPPIDDGALDDIEKRRLAPTEECLAWIDGWRIPLVAELRLMRTLLRRSYPLLQDVAGSEELTGEIHRAIGSNGSW
jgi:hypothetical protein